MLYDYPQYYELAFSFRDLTAETAFMRACIDRYSRIPVTSALELGCGPAPHAGILSSTLGCRYIGMDINSAMLRYAEQKWSATQPAPKFLHGNMVSFQLDRPVDFVFVMLGSLYLHTPEETNSHFDSVARALKPGGLYFLDWCIQFEDPLKYKDSNAFSIERDGVRLDSRFDIKLVDADRQLYEETWMVDIDDHGKRRQFSMKDHNKAILPGEFLSYLKTRDDFRFVGWWRDWDLSSPIHDDCEIRRPVTLLQRI